MVNFLFFRKKSMAQGPIILYLYFFMFTRTPAQKKRVEKTKLKNQNHKNQAGQQYIHQNIMG
jgi:hypothetical protein